MPKHFMKTKSCGCIVKATSVGIKRVDNKVLYMLGGYAHIEICEKCNEHEVNDIDTLYDMWTNDNITDGSGNDGWEECSYYIRKVGISEKHSKCKKV